MEKIKVDKTKLLEILKKNRETHRGVFEQALEGYKAHALAVFEEQLALVREGKKFHHQWSFVQPVDQTKDYDRAIAMLEMSLDTTIDLSESDFMCYVQDRWAWKTQWAASNKLYTSNAMWTGEDAHL